MPHLPGLRQQAQSLLQRAESTPATSWQITAEEHATMVSLADVFALRLPLSAFRSAAGAAHFLRLVLAATDGPAPASAA
jgi:hypothetical protein